MEPASQPANEVARLESLRQRAILDTPPEAEYDDLTALAAHVCEAPMAMITLVDEDRQWFKSCVGCPITETPRDIAFCAHTILQSDVWVVPDVLADDRFADNPLVTGEPHIRFYAGAPLVTPDGHALGALCVMDRQPRKLTEEQGRALRVLARHVVTMLELRRSLQEEARAEAERDRAQAALYLANEALERRVQERTAALEATNARLQDEIGERKLAEEAAVQAQDRFRTLFEEAPVMYFIARLQDNDLIILDCNKLFLSTLGYSRSEVVGRPGLDFVTPETRQRVVEEGAYQRVLEGAVVLGERDFVARNGRVVHTLVRSVRETDAAGRGVGARVALVDITERKRAEAELESQRAYLNELFENSPEGIALLDTENRVTRVNGAFTRMFGHASDKARGRSIYDLLVPDDLKTGAEVYRRQIARGERVVAESVRLRKDGSRLDVAILGVPITISGGQLARYVIYQDITERKRAERALQQENVYLHEVLRSASQFGDVIGESAALSRVLANVEQVAGTDSTVLITGETGTGKEIIARNIHRLSDRRDRMLVTVNCAALPATLIESELFGHEKGAFTGAQARKIGLFEMADRGTLFLDEIGDLPLELQAKLLRVLQEGEFQRVGGTATIRADVRVIGATNRDLEKAVQEGTFRADLYYRLNVFPIALPPLRERPGDIPPLVLHFVRKFSQKLGKTIEAVSQPTLDALSAYPWPGNVRELENVIERSVIISHGPTLELGEWLPKPKASPGEGPFLTLAEHERQHILQALEVTGWRVSGPHGAAALLGLKPTTLEARMKKLGITRK